MCDLITQRLQEQSVVMLAQDSFYRTLSEEEKANVKGAAARRRRALPPRRCLLRRSLVAVALLR